MNNTLSTMGKIIFALCIAFFGVGHLTNAAGMAGMVPSFLSSMAVPIVYLTGVFLIAVALSVIINKYAKWACILLAIFLLFIVFTVHVPGMSNPEGMMSQISISMAVKDCALAGAALFIGGHSKS
ncbi:MAG: DoxX family membrane protein [Chitinophagales bacterium]|nr:DoxX family membrane protein [Chitinophagales bacterium]